MTEYAYTCVFCYAQLRRYEVRMAEFQAMFESDEIVEGSVVRAPTRIISCTFPLYACHHCIVERSGILVDESTKFTT